MEEWGGKTAEIDRYQRAGLGREKRKRRREDAEWIGLDHERTLVGREVSKYVKKF